MSDPIDLALRREVRQAIAETLQDCDTPHPYLQIDTAAHLAIVRAKASLDDLPAVKHQVCLEGLRQRLILRFG